ncbi:hypothetical protein Pst134EA_000552 [Puccinia striiformis f. sp. tritici]|uniref:hypothetical protein n=1 Tax=Puccinia striiformis f. sp. tritici TaxID=168172 RepID=UPI0020085FEB|nr:hypothetical protein Pst134EA_000552 [Puccinia striiformis f. sp. tritici]KAH9473477.1 hypothetical protein Pst134EA_000552 [Puccinia striiformis f. sp. tritici]
MDEEEVEAAEVVEVVLNSIRHQSNKLLHHQLHPLLGSINILMHPEAVVVVVGVEVEEEEGGQNFNSWSHSNSPGASGQSSPRGYPPRNKFVQQGPPQRGGGLGFQNPNISSAFRSNNTSNQFGEPQRTTRGTSDPRLWIPIKFVKGTSLTDKSLENPPEENLDEIEGKQKKPETQKYTPPIPGKLQPYAPEVIPQPTSPSDRLWEIEEVTPASAEQWQTDFPGIFKQECSSSTFQTLPSTPQASESTTPADVAILGETGSSGDNKSNEPHIITNDSQETSTKEPRNIEDHNPRTGESDFEISLCCEQFSTSSCR